MNRDLSLHMRSLASLDQVTLKKSEGYTQAVGIANSPILDHEQCVLLLQKKPNLFCPMKKTTVTTTSRNTHCNRLQPRAVRSCSLNL
jgi:hypothetical protein